MKKSIQREIDKAIKSIWLNEICQDYGNGLLLREASLQCSFYHHLMERLGWFFRENDLYLYPEFYFQELGFRADLVIAKMDMGLETRKLSDRMTDIAAIVELKYDGGDAKSTAEYIKADLAKLRKYAQNLEYDCQYYFGVIYETECIWLHWFDRRRTNHWADGCVTELNAGKLDETMYFEVNSYNHMNDAQKRVQCEKIW